MIGDYLIARKVFSFNEESINFYRIRRVKLDCTACLIPTLVESRGKVRSFSGGSGFLWNGISLSSLPAVFLLGSVHDRTSNPCVIIPHALINTRRRHLFVSKSYYSHQLIVLEVLRPSLGVIVVVTAYFHIHTWPYV